MEPYPIMLREGADTHGELQHDGVEFIYMTVVERRSNTLRQHPTRQRPTK